MGAAVAFAILSLGACGGWSEPPAENERPQVTVRVATTAGGEFAEVPMLAAHQALAGAGYRIEEQSLAQAELTVETLSRGTADLAHGSLPAYWAAIARGAAIVTVMEPAGNGHLLVGTKAITTCRDLHGRKIAVNSLGATGGTLVRAFIQEVCPGTAPEYMVMTGSRNRVAALLAGAIDGAALLRMDVAELQTRSDVVSFIEDFAVRWPDLAMVGIFANRDFAARHPKAVEDYIRECLRAQRELSTSPTRMAEAARTFLKTDRDLLPIAKAHIDAGTWDGRGGMTDDRVEKTLQFFRATGWLKDVPQGTAFVDRSYLDRALASLDGPVKAGQ
jgi:ABC-type nitrate/sulfonate/bicarbonate transport system substrate-binding protein